MAGEATAPSKGLTTVISPLAKVGSIPAEVHIWNFDIDRPELKPEHVRWIPTGFVKPIQSAIEVRNLTDPRIYVHGHCSRTGTEARNERLAEDRANHVATELTWWGLGDVVTEVKGFGYQFPFDKNGTPRGRARNRRVELKIVEAAFCRFTPKRFPGRDFSVRTVGGASGGAGFGAGVIVIEIKENWSGETRRFVFRGAGGTLGLTPVSGHGPSTWTNFTTSVPMFAEDFAGGGQIASASVKPLPAGGEAAVLVFYCKAHETQRVAGVGLGSGVSIGIDSFLGEWLLAAPGSPASNM